MNIRDEIIGIEDDNISLFLRNWNAVSNPDALVLLIHGSGEHGLRYHLVAEQMASQNITLLTLDLEGHGQSSGKRGHFSNLKNVLGQIDYVIGYIQSQYEDIPFFLYGHSMGGNIVLRYSIEYSPKLAGVIVTSPWLELAFIPPTWKEWIGKKLVSIFPSLTTNSGLVVEHLYDEGRVAHEELLQDPFVHRRISLKAYTDIQASGQEILQQTHPLAFPVLLMHGTRDQITSYDASKRASLLLGDECTFISWDMEFHELHNCSNGNEVVVAIIQWIKLII